MDRSVHVVLDEAFRDEDGILKVVTIPGHKRDQDVPAKRQFTKVSRGSIGEHVAGGNFITHRNQRPLVDGGILVRAGVLHEVIDVDAGIAGFDLFVVYFYHNA